MTSAKKLTYDHGQRQRWEAIAERLSRKVGLTGREALVRNVVGWMSHHLWQRFYYTDDRQYVDNRADTLDTDDVLDALRLVPAARQQLDFDERDLIRAARHMGVSWEQIGVALGAAETGARQTARGRFSRLGCNPNDAKVGATIAPAEALVEAPPAAVVAPAPADDWPLPGEGGTRVPEATFVEPTLLDVDQGDQR